MNKKDKYFKWIRLVGLPALFYRLFQKRRISIFVFHDMDEQMARRTINYINKKYNIISLKDLLYHRDNDSLCDLPNYAAILTFDDGHKGNYQLLPLFEEFIVEPCVFLCSEIVGTNRHFWFNHIPKGISAGELKNMTNREMLLELKDFSITHEYEKPDALSLQQLNEMKHCVDFQSHGLFHPCLPKCDDKTAKDEVQKSKTQIESMLGKPVYAFCFPNGDYSCRDIEYIKKAGYACALTVDFGYNNKATDIFRLKRISVNHTNSVDELFVKTSGAWSFLKILFTKKSYGLQEPVKS